MKVLNNILKVLTLVLAVAGLVFFFTDFVRFNYNGEAMNFVGAQLAFGADKLYKSPKILFCMILAIVSVIAAGFNFTKSKSKASRYFQIAFSAVSGIYMLVVALDKPWNFFDLRPYTTASDIVFAPFVLITAIVLLASLASGIAFLLVEDSIVAKSEGKLTIPKRVAKFFREYKSEVKKIVWPGPRSVVKNTLIVLAICAILGVFIWLLDYGLSSLINLILA